MTAEELQRNQAARFSVKNAPGVVRLELLREQDFGSLELVHWSSRRAQHTLDPKIPNPEDPSFRPQETTEAMAIRAELFLNDFILPHFASAENARESEQECVAVVSHGLFLSVLWQTLLRKFRTSSITLGPNVETGGYNRPLEHLPSWTNTGFLEVTIQRPVAERADQPRIQQHSILMNIHSSALSGYSMTVHGVNSRGHLVDLKRTRGGLGSSPHDVKQQSLDGFFKRPKPNGPAP
ncbi:hypothetical protein AYL99_10493 [Fonsecaea erecta]|uniref:Phosphoglycerate mutase n=1 Tax=Fonsecaea erecta TaxID=1367422 RepID=A0A178Z6W5_9EURO|nr:hypothetical protein AYL99_10493 [Fonsecaea erecta]OAP55520.1 hypothetical protein AYL99_10493 [Fonsecaea erecta]